MKEIQNIQLSDELQELYLENKQWLSDVLFLQDEARFLKKTIGQFFLAALQKDHLQQVQKINASISKIEDRRTMLKKLIVQHQELLESLLKDPGKTIHLQLIEENSKIINEIKALFLSDSSVKKELYILIEQVIEKDKAKHLLNA